MRGKGRGSEWRDSKWGERWKESGSGGGGGGGGGEGEGNGMVKL